MFLSFLLFLFSIFLTKSIYSSVVLKGEFKNYLIRKMRKNNCKKINLRILNRIYSVSFYIFWSTGHVTDCKEKFEKTYFYYFFAHYTTIRFHIYIYIYSETSV